MQFLSISILIISIAFAACFVCGAFGGCGVSKQTAAKEPMQKSRFTQAFDRYEILMENEIAKNGQKTNKKTQRFKRLKSKKKLPNESTAPEIRDIRDMGNGIVMRDVINAVDKIDLVLKGRKSTSKK
ncbi:hypothetical protein GPALN_012412 [Globodera pallida]|nr:hypothetical protein GPALN_012412 [Globodera pallida]